MAEFITILKEIRGTTFDVNGVPTNGMWFDVKTSHAAVMLLEGSTISAAAAALISKDAAAAAATASGNWAAAAVISKDAAAAAAAAALISKDAAAAAAAAALISKDAAAAAAVTATAKSNEIKGITIASVSTGIAGSAATVSYNPLDGKFYFTIPQGTKGEKGDSFAVNSMGLFAQRALFDAQIGGFSFLALDTSMIYFKLSSTSGDWSLGSSFGKGDMGPQGEQGYGWLHGAGVPDNINGRDNDFYMNMANADVYIKVAGTWNYFVNLSAPIDDTTVSALTTWSSQKVSEELALKANQSTTYTKTENNTLLNAKQATLVSGTNIKTINSTSILGSGDITISSIGAGGTVTTVPLTLTSASTAQQSLTASAYNQTVTLPDATTLSEGVNVFGLYNNSPYAILVKDAGGNLLGFIASNTQVNCSLADSTTANGTWNLSNETLVGIIGQKEQPFSYVGASGILGMKSILIDTDKYLIIVSISGGYMEGVIYDAITGSFGNSAIIRTGAVETYLNAIQISAGMALIVSGTAGGGTLSAVVLSVTGTTITVGTASTVSLADFFSTTEYTGSKITLTKIGTSYLAGYRYGTGSAEIVAMTIAGTTVTMGTPLGQTGGGITPVVYDMGGGVAMVLSQDANATIYAKPVTVSGVTLTGGTGTTLTSNLTGFSCRKLDSGRIAIVYLNTNLWGAIVSLSGTVATNSIVQLGTTSLGGANRFNIHKVGNQLIVACGSSTVNFNTINVLTDNAGVAVAGTSPLLSLSGSNSMLYVGSTATALYIIIHTVNSNTISVLKISISSNNPTISLLGVIRNNNATELAYQLPVYGQGLYDGQKYAREFLTGATFKTFTGFATTSGSFGIKNDSITTMLRPLYISTGVLDYASNPSDDILVMASMSSRNYHLNLQIAKAI